MRGKARAIHESLGGGRVGHGEDDEVGQRQQRVERVGAMQLEPRPAARPGGGRPRPMTCMPKAARRRAVSAPMPPTPTMSAVVSGRWSTPVSSGSGRHSRRELARQVQVQAPRKGQHEGHDVGADVVVVDLAEVGDDDRMGDQLGV